MQDGGGKTVGRDGGRESRLRWCGEMVRRDGAARRWVQTVGPEKKEKMGKDGWAGGWGTQ